MQLKANLLLVAITMFWGMSYTFMVIGLESLQPFNMSALRSFLAFLLAGCIFYKKLININKKLLIYSFIQSFFLVGSIAFPMMGVKTTPASNAGFLVSLTVVFVPIIVCIIDRKFPSRVVSIAIISTLIGIILLTFNSSFTFRIGDFFCLLTAIVYSIYLVLNGKFTKSVDSIAFGIYQMGFAAIISGVLSLLFETPTIPTTTSGWMALLYLGVVSSAIGFIGQTYAQQYTTPIHTGLIFSLEPIFASLFAILFLHEPLTARLIIGGIFIFGGNILAQLEQFYEYKKIKLEKLPT